MITAFCDVTPCILIELQHIKAARSSQTWRLSTRLDGATSQKAVIFSHYRVYLNSHVHYRVHRNLTLIPILYHMNSSHIIFFCSFYILTIRYTMYAWARLALANFQVKRHECCNIALIMELLTEKWIHTYSTLHAFYWSNITTKHPFYFKCPANLQRNNECTLRNSTHWQSTTMTLTLSTVQSPPPTTLHS